MRFPSKEPSESEMNDLMKEWRSMWWSFEGWSLMLQTAFCPALKIAVPLSVILWVIVMVLYYLIRFAFPELMFLILGLLGVFQ
jgi:hypothetical protein